MKIKKNTSLAAVCAVSICILLATGCKKSPVSSAPQSPSTTVQLAMPTPHPSASAAPDIPANAGGDAEFHRFIEKKYASDPAKAKEMVEAATQLDALGDAEEKLAEFHRLTMVVPARADFKPEPVRRKIRLQLTVEKPMIRVGGRPRFRLELTNVGSEPIDYAETRASFFVKDASVLDSSSMRFYLIDPQGKRTKLLPGRPPENFEPNKSPEHDTVYLPDSMPEAEKEKWLRETNAMGQARATFDVKLKPGETLHSIGDDDSPKENFRTLFSRAHFDKPGTYQLQVEMDDRPAPLDKEYIEFNLRTGSTLEEINKTHERRLSDALGPVSSNAAKFEVAQ